VRVAVIGAGVAGLTAAYRLGEAGHECDVYERWPGLGGQVATVDAGDGHLLERYYHHLFTSDVHLADLHRELGLGEVEWLPSSVAFFAEGESRPFTSPLDLLRFKPLKPLSRIRMGVALLWLQRRYTAPEPLEGITAHEWIVKAMGAEVWEKLLGPLLRGKFGDRAEDIAMSWLWCKLSVRRKLEGREARQELLGYPPGSFQPLLERLAERIGEQGGRVLIDRPAVRIAKADGGFEVSGGAADSFRRGHDPREFEAAGEPKHYDAVLATVPNDVFEQLLAPELAAAIGDEYLGRLRSIEYHTALCVLLELDRQFTPYYWTNVADPELPFVGLIEQTNLIGPEHYGGRRFLYVANYVAQGDPLLELDHDGVLDRYEPGLRKVNPAFSRDWVERFWVFREPAAQPIVTVGYPHLIPPLQTGVDGLVLANTTQIYPEDRGTNYSVRLGERAARELTGAGG
jgi:protoporphyrinogen oxidase